MVQKITPVSYTYIGDDQPRIGFIAQRVADIVPEAVSENGDLLVLEPFALTAVLFGAVKKLLSQK